ARLAEPDPGLDTALLVDRAVLVEDALDPQAAHLAVGTVGEDRAVLHRDIELVVEAIGDPSADLRGRQLALVHPDVERMVDVVARLLCAQLVLEFLPAPRPVVRLRAHSEISIPSKATSIPARSSSRRCAESSSRIGLVLLIWISTLRACGSFFSHESIPSSPDCARCPISSARLRPAPS